MLCCRDEADEQAGEERKDERKQEDGSIDSDLVEARQAGRPERQHGFKQARRRDDPTDATHQAQQKTFDHKVARNACPARSERRPYRELLCATVSAHQQEVGDVCTDDQHHHAERPHQDPQHAADITDNLGLERPEARLHWPSRKLVAGVSRWRRELLDGKRHYAREVGGCVGHRHARLQTRDALEDIAPQRHLILIELERIDEIHRSIEKPEALGHDSDHVARLAVDRQLSTNDGGVGAEAALPVPVGENHRRRTAGAVVASGEFPTKDR